MARAADEVPAALATLLRPLAKFLTGRDPSIVEVCVNGPGAVWIERSGERRWTREAVGEITSSWLYDLAVVLANATDRTFTRRLPILGAPLPGGHRLQLIVGSNVASTMACSIRIKRRVTVTLADFGFSEEQAALLRRTVIEGRPMLIVGGTSSGKTTLLNRLLADALPPDRRVISIEDVPELEIPCENKIQFFLARTESATDLVYADIIDTSTRMRPDLIICGELSVHNAVPMVRLLNTGHDGMMMTVHANSAPLGLKAWADNFALSKDGRGNVHGDLIPYLARAIDLLVHIRRGHDGSRQVTEIVDPKKMDLRRALVGEGE